MISPPSATASVLRWPALLRYGAGLGVSALVNGVVILSLAQLGQPTFEDDDHAAHRVRPSVVKPPPPTQANSASSTARSNPVLPARPEMPSIDLPALPDSLGLPGLITDGLDDVGLGDLTFAGASAVDDAPRTPDEPPQLSVPPDLARFYPDSARQRGIGGRTILRVDVDAQGRVRAAEVLMSEPAGIFDQAAVRAARRFTFSPAKKNGRAVSGQTRLELKWQPRR